MKTKPTLLDWTFILEMADRMTSGQEKHPDGETPFYMTLSEQELTDKLLRHAMVLASGEKIDPETNQSHLVAIACNAMMAFRKMSEPSTAHKCRMLKSIVGDYYCLDCGKAETCRHVFAGDYRKGFWCRDCGFESPDDSPCNHHYARLASGALHCLDCGWQE